MGRPKPAEVKKTETTDQSYQNKNVSDQTHASTGLAGGMNINSSTGGSDTSTTGSQETAAQRKTRMDQLAKTQGTVGTTGASTTTGTGRQDTTSKTGGSSENIFQFTDRPDTADTKAFRDSLLNYQGVQDPTISYNAANQREQVLRMAQNPLGAYTTPESRQAITQALFSQIGQQEGQSYLQDAFNRSQQKLQTMGLQGQLANMTQPLRELMGTKQSQEASQTGVSSQDQSTANNQMQTQDLSTMTTGSSTQDDMSQMKSMTDQISNYFQDAFGANVGYSDQQDVSHGEQTGEGTSHGTNVGNQTSTSEQPNIWNQVIGGAANMAAFM